jgi:hypothetical protein
MLELIGTARHSSLLAIVLGGFLAGTIDIGAAALINNASPVVILKFIAGGILGACFARYYSSAATPQRRSV